MSAQRILGRYNWIYCLKGPKGIESLCDRAHNKKPVRFEEGPLEDLAGTRREPSNLHMVEMAPQAHAGGAAEEAVKTSSEIVADRSFTVVGDSQSIIVMGFGRGLRYRAAQTGSDRIAILLTVTLPECVRYRIACDPLRKDENCLAMPEDIYITVFTRLPWSIEDAGFVAETGKESGEITFLIESVLPLNSLLNTLIVVPIGSEREGVLARAACGLGFVPCLVWDRVRDPIAEGLRTFVCDARYQTIISVGAGPLSSLASDGITSISFDDTDTSAGLSRKLGISRRSTVIAPDAPDAYGPSLYLALAQEADLSFVKNCGTQITLVGENHHVQETWELGALIGRVLSPIKIDETCSSHHEELSLIENTPKDLLVCQGIGYACLRGTAVGFIPQIEIAELGATFVDPAAAISFYQELCANAVPDALRSPAVDRLTVFTAQLPLHLTPLPRDGDSDAEEQLRWVDRYVVCHLPGHTASVLVPRVHSGQIREAPPVPHALVFDALGDLRSSEAAQVSAHLEDRLSYPIVLPRAACTQDLLRELTTRLATEFILLITHGSDDYIEDGEGGPIGATEIANWKLKGNPFVFNNSCSSWFTTGQAFLDAGARGLIATLWPVASVFAADIAAQLGERLGAEPESSLPVLLSKLLQRRGTSTASDATRWAYIYVGLPDARPVIRMPLDSFETVSFLCSSLIDLDQLCWQLAVEGRPDLAVTVRKITREPLRRRFLQLLQPGTLPMHLPPPFQMISVLDIDYLLASMDVQLAQAILSRTVAEQQDDIVRWMDDRLDALLKELIEWNDRHDTHNGETQEVREARSAETGVPFRAMSSGNCYRLLIKAVYEQVLPFVKTLAGQKLRVRAEYWLRVAGVMVTTPKDLSPDYRVTDENLIHRILEGNKEKARIYNPDGDNHNEAIEFDLLDQEVGRADLLNRFGIACLNLDHADRAIAFFRAGLSVAPPGTQDHANICSNLNKAQFLASKSLASLDGYLETIARQGKLGDYRNACISAANYMRFSARIGEAVDAAQVGRWLTWTESLQPAESRIDARCDILSAWACVEAAQGNVTHIWQLCEEIAQRLSDPYPHTSVPVHLNEVVFFLDESGRYVDAVRQAKWNAEALEHAGFRDVAARTLIAACSSAGKLLQGPERDRYFLVYLDCSELLGARLRQLPGLREELADWVEPTWRNSLGMWEHFAQAGQTRLAVRAYHCVKAWDPNAASADWDLLVNAYHPINIRALQSLASLGQLRRKATVLISSKDHVHISVVTERSARDVASSAQNPRSIYCLYPIESLQNPSSTTAATCFVGGTAVFPLEEGAQVAVVGNWASGIATNNSGTFLYRDVWGSKLFPYKIDIAMEPGLVPIHMAWNGEPKHLVGTQVTLAQLGFRLRLATSNSPLSDVCGLGKLEVYYIKDLEAWQALRNMDLFKQGAMGFIEFFMLTHLLFRKKTS